MEKNAPPDIMIQPWEDLLEDERSEWLNLINGLNLPPLTSVGSTDSDDPAVFARQISSDPLLAGKVLAVANSAAMGRSREVQSLEQATVYMGTNLVQTIVVAYQLESMLHERKDYPRKFFTYIRDWAAASSCLGYNIAVNVMRRQASETGTAALLARLGALVLGTAQPRPDAQYPEMQNEAGRLKLETGTWGVTSPVLSGQLARAWGLPEQLCIMLERSWEPLFNEMPDSEESRRLTMVTAAVALGVSAVGNPRFDARTVLERANSEVLKANLRKLGLLDKVVAACASTRTQRDLTALQKA